VTKMFSLLGFIAELPAIERDFHAAGPKILERAAQMVQKKAKSTIGKNNENWAPLALGTIADKQRKGFKTPAPLLRTGELRDSIEYTIVSDHEACVGTDLEYAKFLEFGTSRMPPRSFLVSAAIASEDKIQRMAGATAVAALSGHGRGARDVREMLHALHRAGHALKEIGEDLLDDDRDDEGNKK
jgi:HK97 gp10 family phage protein